MAAEQLTPEQKRKENSRAKSAKWRLDHPDYAARDQRERRKANPERYREAQRRRYLAHPGQTAAQIRLAYMRS